MFQERTLLSILLCQWSQVAIDRDSQGNHRTPTHPPPHRSPSTNVCHCTLLAASHYLKTQYLNFAHQDRDPPQDKQDDSNWDGIDRSPTRSTKFVQQNYVKGKHSGKLIDRLECEQITLEDNKFCFATSSNLISGEHVQVKVTSLTQQRDIFGWYNSTVSPCVTINIS